MLGFAPLASLPLGDDAVSEAVSASLGRVTAFVAGSNAFGSSVTGSAAISTSARGGLASSAFASGSTAAKAFTSGGQH